MTDYLTNEEIDSLSKDLRKSYITGLLLGLMVIIICFLLTLFNTERLTVNHVFLFVGLFLLTLAFTFYLTKNLRTDISNGKKDLIDYEIIDKSAFEDDDPGIGGAKITYHLKSNSKKFSVTKDLYDQANIHDHLIEHLAPITGQLLKIEIKKSASLQQPV